MEDRPGGAAMAAADCAAIAEMKAKYAAADDYELLPPPPDAAAPVAPAALPIAARAAALPVPVPAAAAAAAAAAAGLPARPAARPAVPAAPAAPDRAVPEGKPSMLWLTALATPAQFAFMRELAVPLEVMARGGSVSTTQWQHVKCAACGGHRHKDGAPPPLPPGVPSAAEWAARRRDRVAMRPMVPPGGLGVPLPLPPMPRLVPAAAGDTWEACKTCKEVGWQPTAGELAAVSRLRGMCKPLCPACRGMRFVLKPDARCLACDGAGAVARHVTFPVRVPPGLRRLDMIVMEEVPSYAPAWYTEGGGWTEAAEHPLVLFVSRAVPDRFAFITRSADTLFASVAVPILAAMLGGHNITIPHPDGYNVQLPIPTGKQLWHGQVLRVAGGTLAQHLL